MILYKFARIVVKGYLKIFYKWKVVGRENVPNRGSIIFIANHISNFDPPVLACSVNRHVHFMAKEELFNVPVLKIFLQAIGSFSIKRGGNDRKAIKNALELLKNDKTLSIFPEGTRSKNGEIGKGLPGAALFALKSDATVIPVGLVSNYKLFKPIFVNIGKPISLEQFKQDKITSEKLSETIDYMMNQVRKQVDEIKKNEDTF